MRQALTVLAHLLICTALLSLPIKSYAEEAQENPDPQQIAAASDDIDANLISEMQAFDGFQPSEDLNQAVESLPDAE
jgi:hypothetical protein